MITLSNGVKKPESGDIGAPVFSALNGNADILNNHTHNGTNSNRVSSLDITKPFVNLPTGSWAAQANGFKQTVTCPGAVTLDVVTLRFRVRTGALQHQIIFPTIIPSSLTSFDVIVNDSTLDLECLFV